MTLRIVKPGDPVPDDSLVSHARDVAAKIVAAAEAGNGYFVYLDTDEATCTWGGEMLEMACLAEQAARDLRDRALGFDP